MKNAKRTIRVVIVDDSMRYRSLLSWALKDHPLIEIIGEAVNGIEALDLIWHKKPDVVLMDFEMPIMDGMTALQHLMIHIPTPVIMFSHLTREGTARCFDALKNGAVDFFCKDILPPQKNDEMLMRVLAERVICASHVSVKAAEPIFPKSPKKKQPSSFVKTLVFCEECGAKTELIIRENEDQGGVICSNCDEYISLEQRNRYRRANFFSVIIGGEGAFINLLKLIPKLPQDINGAILVLIDATVEHVDSFTRYLNSISTMNVLRFSEGTSIQGGNCYIGCENEGIILKPYTAEHKLHSSRKPYNDIFPVDRALISVSQVFKDRSAVVFLSGNEPQGEKGVDTMTENGGNLILLKPERCLYKRMCHNILDNYSPEVLENEELLAERINDFHLRYRDTIVTA